MILRGPETREGGSMWVNLVFELSGPPGVTPVVMPDLIWFGDQGDVEVGGIMGVVVIA